MSDSFLKSWIVPHLASVSMGLYRKNTGTCCPFLLHEGKDHPGPEVKCVSPLSLAFKVNFSWLSHWGNFYSFFGIATSHMWMSKLMGVNILFNSLVYLYLN